MDNKASNDIDRKLAIYYHPLFQEIIKAILDLFKMNEDKFEVGLLEFVQFNLKLQKALLPTFEIDNALVSGLNDWVKQVAECLTYQGMISTAGCIEVLASNMQELLAKQYDNVQIELFRHKDSYIQSMLRISTHDAFKLLGVKINKQVCSKFLFDLCSTWCEFLDIELFSYFLIGLYIQISGGETIEDSQFRNTLSIETIDLEFMEEFEEIKGLYSRSRKKDLRYYRAWCEWNYLRVNEVGEQLILKLDQLHTNENRIVQLAMIFERAINVINQEITSQNSQKQVPIKTSVDSKPENKDFLILKKINIDSENREQVKQKHHINKRQQLQMQQQQYQEEAYEELQVRQDFEIQIDEQGNMYLKRIVRLPVLGKQIQPSNFEDKQSSKRNYIHAKKQKWRSMSNLYGRMEGLKIHLEHSTNNDYYTFKKNPKIKLRDEFYRKDNKVEKTTFIDQTIHERAKLEDPIQESHNLIIPQVRKEERVSIQQNHEYIHQIMAPSFLTDNQNNLCYVDRKEGQIYSSNANSEKRDLRVGLPKLNQLEFRVKPMKSYHLIGKLTTDRSLINERTKAVSLATQEKPTKMEALKDQHQYIWSRYISQQEMKQLTNYQDFYRKLEIAKRKFGMEFQSQFRGSLKPMLAYDNKRYELGGVLTKQDQQRFSERIKRLINKQNRRNKRKGKKIKMRQYRNHFKNKKDKSLFEDIFVNYHRDALKSLKKQRAIRYNSMYSK